MSIPTLLTRDPHQAATVLRSGRLVAFPTETVYGLGADAFNAQAVHRIFSAKKRPTDNPLIVHIAHLEQLDSLALSLSSAAQTLIETFFPGPLSIIANKRPEVPDIVTGGLDTVAIRMPQHPVAQVFLRTCRSPVAAPSANLSGRPSATTWQAVYNDLGGRIACLLQGEHTTAGLESTVVDCSDERPVVLRAGVLPVERLRTILPDLHTDDKRTPQIVRSPGMRYPHYAPHGVQVELVASPHEAQSALRNAYIGLVTPEDLNSFGMTQVCTSPEDYAHALFDFFRRCEVAGSHTIYCQTVKPTGIGRALMDRLTKAATAAHEQ